MPPNTVSVARPGPFGNPFKIADLREAGYRFGDAQAVAFCVWQFGRWLAGDTRYWMGPESERARATILARLPELRGKNLACWCKPGDPCHADVLLELANEPTEGGRA